MAILSAIQELTNFIYSNYLQTWIDRNWPHIEPYYKIIKSIVIQSLVVFVIASICLYISAFLFGVVYFYNMPTIHHTFDLNFQYNRQCIEEHRNYQRRGSDSRYLYDESCYPTAIADLGSSKENELLQPNQNYRLSLKLILPESESNLKIGMFMVTMECGDLYSSKSVSMRYQPLIIQIASSILFWPLLLFNMMETQQILNVPLFDNVRFESRSKEQIKNCMDKVAISHNMNRDYHCEHWMAKFKVDYPDIQLYSAQLQVTATFSGLQFILFQWPVFSFLVGTAIFFVPVLAMILVLIYIVFFKPYSNVLNSIMGDQGDGHSQYHRRRHDRNLQLSTEASGPGELHLVLDDDETEENVGSEMASGITSYPQPSTSSVEEVPSTSAPSLEDVDKPSSNVGMNEPGEEPIVTPKDTFVRRRH